MAVKFGKDGTIYCNTVKYNYKQTRNLVADNGYCYNHWSLSSCSTVVEDIESRRSYYSLHFPSGDGLRMSTQPMPTPIANHKYYGGIFWKTGNNFSAADGRFEWYYTDGDTNVNLTFAQKIFYSTNNNWVLLSSIVQAGNNPTSGQWIIRNFIVNGTTNSYCAKPIIVDLTECFGAGNEPTKEWCDENILEWTKYIGENVYKFNEANVSSQITRGSSSTSFVYFSVYNITNGNQYFFNRIDIPRSYCVDMQSGTDVECHIYLPSTSLNVSTYMPTYYAFVDLSQPNGNYNKSYDWYFPVQEPHMGKVPQVENGQFNSGGGLYNWKRISFFSDRTQFTIAADRARFDFNNGGTQLYLALTNFYLATSLSVAGGYASVHNINPIPLEWLTSFEKSFYDRWAGGDCDCVIHIKNHLNKTIKFNTSYDIICNDIEIRPELNKIYYKPDGTIVCHNLVRTQKY